MIPPRAGCLRSGRSRQLPAACGWVVAGADEPTTTTMKINNNSQIEKACSVDPARPIIHSPYLDVVDSPNERIGTVVATDGRIIAMIPCELEEGDQAGIIPADRFKAARKKRKHPGIYDTAEVPCDSPGTGFPQWRQVIPPSDTYAKSISVRLDAQLLLNLAAALSVDGSRKIELVIPLEDDSKTVNGHPAMKVYPSCTRSQGVGYIMPIRSI